MTPPATAPVLGFFDETPSVIGPPPVGGPDVDSGAEVDVEDVATKLEVEADRGAVISVLLVSLSSCAAVALKSSRVTTLRKAQAGIAVPTGTGRGNLSKGNIISDARVALLENRAGTHS